MSKLFKTVAAGLLLSVGTAASALESDWFFKPYVGGDVGAQHQDFETGFGDFHFKSSYPVTNLYAGVNLHKYVGVEAGYEHMYQRTRNQYYADDGTRAILGYTPLAPVGNHRSYISNVWSNGFTLSAILKFPIYKDLTEVFATLGANWARHHYETMKIQNNRVSTRPLFWRSDRHAIARIGFGINHKIAHNFGGRVQYIWEGTEDLDAAIFPGVDREGPTNVPVTPTSSAHFHTVKPKGSHLVMAGLYYQADWV